jgi:hypothetical protein
MRRHSEAHHSLRSSLTSHIMPDIPHDCRRYASRLATSSVMSITLIFPFFSFFALAAA